MKTKKRKIEEKINDVNPAEIKPENKEEIRKGIEKQMKWIIAFFVIVIIAVIIVYSIFTGAGRFDYIGLEFQKEKRGNVMFYLTQFPLTDDFGNVVSYLPTYFREDPRKTTRIVINGSIRLKESVALAAEKEIVEGCEDSILAATTLSLYLKQLGISSFGATTNKTAAEELKREYVSCDDTSEYSIVIFQLGNESRIDRNGDCYTLQINNCEMMNVTERFMLGVYANYKNLEI
ncbi:hypothetical protein HYW76_04330 [Candidatus Pacearchaeota archaeon]|nr:hypothetical protein [Candidatus Pacearchaeota archaeon]